MRGAMQRGAFSYPPITILANSVRLLESNLLQFLMFENYRGEKKLLAIELVESGYSPELINKFLGYRVPSWALVYRLLKEKNSKHRADLGIKLAQ